MRFTTATRLLGVSTFRNISNASYAVCFIDYQEYTGTGFLVERNVVLTCNHVIPTLNVGRNCKFRFNFVEEKEKVEEQSYTCVVPQAGTPLFVFNIDLDYTLIEVDTANLPEPSILPMEIVPFDLTGTGNAAPHRFQYGTVIGHHDGKPMRAAPDGCTRNAWLSDAMYNEKLPKYLEHRVETEKGASGSPFVDQEGRLLGLHLEAWRDDKINRATFINTILEDVSQKARADRSLAVRSYCLSNLNVATETKDL